MRDLIETMTVFPPTRQEGIITIEVAEQFVSLIDGCTLAKALEFRGVVLVAEARYRRSPRPDDIRFPIEVIAA